MSLGIAFAVLGSLLALGRIWVIRVDAKRRPNRATFAPVPWGIWAVLTVLALAPQLKAGSWKWSMLLLVANLIVNVTFLTLALGRRSERSERESGWTFSAVLLWRYVKQMERSDQVSVVIATVSITLFLALDNMAFALIASLTADFVGIVRTWIKACQDPDGEVIANWVLALLASLSTTACGYFTDGAVFQKDALESWYPAYAVGNAIITVILVVVMRRVVARRSVVVTPVPATEAA